jgi:hypothetical protein
VSAPMPRIVETDLSYAHRASRNGSGTLASLASAPEGGEERVRLYMDVHDDLPEGATAADVAKAHKADLQVQERFGVRYLNYWVDEGGHKVFCLIEAPDAESAHAVHREAHGLVADEIYPVTQGWRAGRSARP